VTSHIRRPPGRFPPTLIRSHRMEMFVAHPAALPLGEVAPVPLIVDDAFYEYAREHRLPDSSVSFLMRAGSYSARNSRSGFVPNSMLADFSDDPDLAVRRLQAAGLIKRADGGGVRIVEGKGVTVVNAADAAANAAEAETAGHAVRSAKSAGGKHGNHERWHARRGIRAPGCEHCEAVPAAEPKRTSHSDRMRLGSDSDATPIDRSRSDLDLSPRVVSKQKRSRPAAREGNPSPGSHAFRIAVTAKFAAVARVDIASETADAIAADVLGGKKHVDRKLLYVLTAIDNEPDPVGRWLPGYAPPAPRKRERNWCGKCDRADRSIWDEQAAGLRWCPDCSPRTIPRWEAA